MKKTIHNVENGQIEIIDLSDSEIKEINTESAKLKEITIKIDKDNEAKAAAKAALLEKLGITEEEAKLLF